MAGLAYETLLALLVVCLGPSGVRHSDESGGVAHVGPAALPRVGNGICHGHGPPFVVQADLAKVSRTPRAQAVIYSFILTEISFM